MSTFLQQEYPPPSFDYPSSSSSADEKFMTSDPGSGFSFGGFSQVNIGKSRVITRSLKSIQVFPNCQIRVTSFKHQNLIKSPCQTESVEGESEAQEEKVEEEEPNMREFTLIISRSSVILGYFLNFIFVTLRF